MLSFTYPVLLWGLVGLSLPILAHMVHRHTTRRLNFPSLRFIRFSQIPRKGRNWPTDILLLLMRLLLAACAILCLAGPRWLPKEASPQSSGQETIVILDNSASMGGWGIPDEVSALLPELLSSIDGKLGAATFTEQHPLGDAARDFLRNYNPSLANLAKGSPENTISSALGLFSPESVSREMVVVSDFQTSDWQLATARLDSLGVSLRLIPVGKIRGGNLSVQGVRITPADDEQIRIWTQIKNHTAEVRTCKVKLQAGGDEWKQDLSVDPDSVVQAQFLLPRDDYIKGRVSINEDAFSADNTYHFWLMAPPARKIEFVMTPRDDEIGEEESFFLRTAIVSSTENEWQKYLVTHHSFKDSDTNPDRDAVFIPGLGKHVSSGQISAILQYAKAGGKVIVTPGESPAETISILREQGFLEADYRGFKDSSASGLKPYRIEGLVEGTPLAKLFSGEAGKDLYLSKISKFVGLRPRGDARPIIELDDSWPLILESPLGKGRVFLCTTRFHGSWCDLPLRNSFLPLVRELLTGFGEQPESQWPSISVGETLSSPDGKKFEGTEPGLFQWENELIAVNVPREESVSGVLPVDTVRESLGSAGRLSTNKQNGPTKPEDELGEPLGQWLALLAAGLFLAESLWVRPRSRKKEAGYDSTLEST